MGLFGRRVWDRLAVKLTLAVVGVAGFVLALVGVAETRAQRRYLIESAVRGADLFGDTIRSLSRGRASYAMTPVRFEPVPAALAEKVRAGRVS